MSLYQEQHKESYARWFYYGTSELSKLFVKQHKSDARMKRVLVISSSSPNQIGGPGTFLRQFQSILSSLPQFRNLQLDYSCKPVSLSEGLGFARRVIGDIIRAYQSNVIFTCSLIEYSACISILTQRPLVIRFVGYSAWESRTRKARDNVTLEKYLESEFRDLSAREQLLRLISGYALKKASVIIVPSLYLKEIVCSLGAAPKSVHVVYNTVENRSSIPVKCSSRAIDCIVVSRLAPWKRVDIAIESAMASSANMYIVGDGEENEYLEERYRKYCLEGRLKFMGNKSHETIIELLQQSKLFLQLSSYEGLSHSLLEALHNGTIPIVSDIPPNREVITHETNGFLEHNQDPTVISKRIDLLLGNPELLNRLSETCVRCATKMGSTHKQIESYLELISSTI